MKGFDLRRRMLRASLAALAGGAGWLLAANAGATSAGATSAGVASAGVASAGAASAGAGAATGSRAPFAFALIGDTPYNALESRMLEQVLAGFDADLAFAIHVGDIKASSERCDDALLAARHAMLDRSPVPLFFTPGDNEWTDCARPRAGRFDPKERLDRLRELFFAAPRPLGGVRPGAAAGGSAGAAADATAGAGAIAGVERQADRVAGGPPENLRWRHGGVRFVSINLPGSNNGLAADGLDAEDWQARERFNAGWLRDTYAQAAAERAAAIVIVAHANPRFDRDASSADGAPGAGGAGRSGALSLSRLAGRTDGYAAFRALLASLSAAFDGPTLLLHGDTHDHRIDRISPKLMRIESYGSPYSNLWLRIDVDPGAPEPFTVTRRRLDPEQPPP